MLQLFEFEQYIFDHVIPRDLEALWRHSESWDEIDAKTLASKLARRDRRQRPS